MIRIGLRAPVHRMLEALARVCVRAKKAERELAESNLVLGSLSTMIDGGIAAREKLVAEVEQLRAELERVKASDTWAEDKDRQSALEREQNAWDDLVKERIAHASTKAELERVKSERAWTTPEDRNG